MSGSLPLLPSFSFPLVSRQIRLPPSLFPSREASFPSFSAKKSGGDLQFEFEESTNLGDLN